MGAIQFIFLLVPSVALLCLLIWGGSTYIRRITRKRERQQADTEESAAEMRSSLGLMQMMLDSAPFVITLWDENYGCINVSGYTLKLFKIKEKREYIENFDGFSPEYQPCGTLSSEKAIMYFKQGFEDGFVNFKWIHQTIKGEPVSMDISMSRFEYKENPCWLPLPWIYGRLKQP